MIKVANAIDYIDWRGDITFDKSPFNEVDALLITQLAMIDFEGIVPDPDDGGSVTLKDAASLFFADKKRSRAPLGLIIPKDIVILFRKMGRCERFAGVRLGYYVSTTDHEMEQQFSAITAELGDGSSFVAFRGTDDTIVGWKEDLNLAFMPSIPSQLEAVSYFNRVGGQVDGGLRVGGHSKGGNLAVYAAVRCDSALKERIIEVYNLDGPGFEKDFLSTDAFAEISERIKTVVPQSSLVGMLFYNGRYTVVKSTEVGIMQHNAISWEVRRNRLVRMQELREQSKKVAEQINLLLEGLDSDSRRRFAEALYGLLTSTDAKTLTELYDDRFTVIRSLGKCDRETRRLMLKIIGILMSDGNGQIFGAVVGSLFGFGKKDEKKKPAQRSKTKPQLRSGTRTKAATLPQAKKGSGTDVAGK